MNTTEKEYGIIAGFSLILMAIAAGFAYGYVQNSLVTESPLETLQNLVLNKALFLAGLSGWVIIFITDLIVAYGLYRYFLNTSKQVSLVTAALRILYTLILGVAIFQLFRIIPELSINYTDINAKYAGEIEQLINHFEKLWSLGLVIFGIHLLGLGYLSVKSVSVLKILGYLLYLGGISYILIHGIRQLDLIDKILVTKAENILSLPMALAEILLAIWLIYKGFIKRNANA